MMEISNAYSKVLELEGLLLLLKSENTDNFKIDVIFSRLFDKIEDINADLESIQRQYKLELYNAAKMHVMDNARIVGQDSVAQICDTTSTDIEDAETDTSSDDNLTSEVPDVVAQDDQEIADSAVFEEMEDADMPICDSQPSIPEPESTAEENSDGPVQEPQTDCPEELKPDTAEHINIVVEDGIDVNRSAFALKTRGDIRKAFTLNDNYKFCRQLFSNSRDDYSATLAKVEGMSSTADAEDYFFNTLGWDKENEDVKEFMTIISAYFMGK